MAGTPNRHVACRRFRCAGGGGVGPAPGWTVKRTVGAAPALPGPAADLRPLRRRRFSSEGVPPRCNGFGGRRRSAEVSCQRHGGPGQGAPVKGLEHRRGRILVPAEGGLPSSNGDGRQVPPPPTAGQAGGGRHQVEQAMEPGGGDGPFGPVLDEGGGSRDGTTPAEDEQARRGPRPARAEPPRTTASRPWCAEPRPAAARTAGLMGGPGAGGSGPIRVGAGHSRRRRRRGGGPLEAENSARAEEKTVAGRPGRERRTWPAGAAVGERYDRGRQQAITRPNIHAGPVNSVAPRPAAPDSFPPRRDGASLPSRRARSAVSPTSRWIPGG